MTISPRIQAAIDYIVARTGEASTWRGIILVATVAGANVTPELTEAIIMLGLGLSGLVGILFSDKTITHKVAAGPTASATTTDSTVAPETK